MDGAPATINARATLTGEYGMNIEQKLYRALILVQHRVGELDELGWKFDAAYKLHMTNGLCSATRWAGMDSGLWHDGTSELGDALHKLGILHMAWPQFSGNDYYPVPGFGEYAPMDRDYPNQQASEEYFRCPVGSMWDAGTQYGQARRELLEFCIDSLLIFQQDTGE